MASKKYKTEQVKDVSTLVKFFFTLGVLAVLLFIGIYFYARVNNSPTAVVDEYVSGFMAKSPSRIFRTLNLKNTRFVTPDTLDTLLESIADYDKITAYSLVKESEEEGKVTYKVNYMMGRLESPFSQVLTLKQTDEPYLFFFKKWVIDSTDLVASRVAIRVPAGASLRVDGVSITEDQIHKKTETTVDYELGDMFIGEHRFEAVLDGFDTYQGTFTLEGKDYLAKPVAKVATNQLSPDAESRNIVKKLVARIIPRLYETLLQRRSYDFFLREVAVEASTREGYRSQYEAIAKEHIDAKTHLAFVEFGNFKSKVRSTVSSDNCYALRVDTTVPFTAFSTVVDEDENPELKQMTGKRHIRSIFHYSDGQWWLYETQAFRKIVRYIKE
ncbi:MAG: hypothetical protein VZQ83_00115 [Eubacterium sp.]|nr:hypothetical protein [Eubacterium sp.]